MLVLFLELDLIRESLRRENFESFGDETGDLSTGDTSLVDFEREKILLKNPFFCSERGEDWIFSGTGVARGTGVKLEMSLVAGVLYADV